MESLPVSNTQRFKLPLLIIGFILLIVLIPTSFFLFKQQASKQTPVGNASLKPSYVCPVAKDSCLSGESINLTSTKPTFSGLAYEKLASGSAIIAIFPGKYTVGASLEKNGSKKTFINIENTDLNIQADYSFKGQAYIPTGIGREDVKQGETIGWLTEEVIDKELFQKQYQLILSVRDLKTKEYLKLEPEQLAKETL